MVRRISAVLAIALVCGPVLFNAVTLWHEVATPAIALNDDAFHYSLIARADNALSNGESVVDHWHPELELGFPQFFYYQHLPHVFVVVLYRAIFKSVSLFTLFNFIRWLLLVCFPLTVYWAMRRMNFSVAAAAVAAAASSLLSGNARYGFEYDSYIWRGLGMYTQLWAMHLSFISLALLYRLRETGKGRIVTSVAIAALMLSHLLYSVIVVVAALVIFLVGINRRNLRARAGALAVVGGLAAIMSSYMWLPFFRQPHYLGASPYLQHFKYDSFGAKNILGWLTRGELLDHGRLPVLTVLLGVGIVAAIVRRTRQTWTVLAIFVVMLLLYFGRTTWGSLTNLVPLKNGILYHRFIGGVDIGAIMLIGLAGGVIWELLSKVGSWPKIAAGGAIAVVFILPAFMERAGYYSQNAEWMRITNDAFHSDTDAQAVLATIAQGTGRTYAGLRNNFGHDLTFGFVHFYDVLTYEGIDSVSPPYQSLSLNSDLEFSFDDQDPTQYELFNVDSVVAPAGQSMPSFLTPALRTSRYTLYSAPGGGVAEFAAVVERASARDETELLSKNLVWMKSGAPGAHQFIRWDYPATSPQGTGPLTSGCPTGRFPYESVLPARVDLVAVCDHPTTIVLKITYHPNWKVNVDGTDVPTYMVSPSYIAFDVPAGSHSIVASYRSPVLKTGLFILGFLVLIASILGRKRIRLLAGPPPSEE